MRRQENFPLGNSFHFFSARQASGGSNCLYASGMVNTLYFRGEYSWFLTVAWVVLASFNSMPRCLAHSSGRQYLRTVCCQHFRSLLEGSPISSLDFVPLLSSHFTIYILPPTPTTPHSTMLASVFLSALFAIQMALAAPANRYVQMRLVRSING